jgi:hypothetical protein
VTIEEHSDEYTRGPNTSQAKNSKKYSAVGLKVFYFSIKGGLNGIFFIKTVLIIVQNDAYLMLKQHLLLSKIILIIVQNHTNYCPK